MSPRLDLACTLFCLERLPAAAFPSGTAGAPAVVSRDLTPQPPNLAHSHQQPLASMAGAGSS